MREFCCCSCLPLLPGFACSIHATWGPPFSRALYISTLGVDWRIKGSDSVVEGRVPRRGEGSEPSMLLVFHGRREKKSWPFGGRQSILSCHRRHTARPLFSLTFPAPSQLRAAPPLSSQIPLDKNQHHSHTQLSDSSYA